MLQSSCAVCWLCGLRRVTQLLWTLALNGVVVGGIEWIAKTITVLYSPFAKAFTVLPITKDARFPSLPESGLRYLPSNTGSAYTHPHTHIHTTEDKAKLQKVSSECVL